MIVDTVTISMMGRPILTAADSDGVAISLTCSQAILKRPLIPTPTASEIQRIQMMMVMALMMLDAFLMLLRQKTRLRRGGDNSDPFPNDASETDIDMDGIGNNTDTDDDGVALDVDDVSPLDASR